MSIRLKSHQLSKIQWFIPENDHFTAISWGPKTLRHTAILGPCLFCLRAFLLNSSSTPGQKQCSQSNQNCQPHASLSTEQIQHNRSFAPSMNKAFWIVLEDMVFFTLFGPLSSQNASWIFIYGVNSLWLHFRRLDGEITSILRHQTVFGIGNCDRLLGCTGEYW